MPIYIHILMKRDIKVYRALQIWNLESSIRTSCYIWQMNNCPFSDDFGIHDVSLHEVNEWRWMATVSGSVVAVAHDECLFSRNMLVGWLLVGFFFASFSNWRLCRGKLIRSFRQIMDSVPERNVNPQPSDLSVLMTNVLPLRHWTAWNYRRSREGKNIYLLLE